MKKICVLLSLLFILTSCAENAQVEIQEEETTSNVNSTSEQAEETNQEQEKRMLITSSIIPMSSLIQAIGQDFVEVENMIPAGVSPHGFDMSARQRATLEDAELVFMTGLDHIDGFLEKSLSKDVQIHLADGIDLIKIDSHDHNAHDEHEDEEHDEHEDDHSSDPHVWLGKDNIIMMAKKIEAELTGKLPEQAEYFATNRKIFESELNAIYDEFAEKTAGKTANEFIVFHDAYNYLFESINLNPNLKIPFSDNVLHDTGTAHMAELIDEIKLHDIKYIFKEPQFSDTNLSTITDEYNLNIYSLDPLGTDLSADGYLNNLRNNLDSLINIYE